MGGCSSLLLAKDPTTLPPSGAWSREEASEQTDSALSQGFFPKAIRRSDQHPRGGRQ